MAAQALRSRLVGELWDAGDLSDPDWVSAVAAVPREPLLPRLFLDAAGGRLWQPVDAGDRRWLDLVHRDAPRVTALRTPARALALAAPDGLAVGTPCRVALAPGQAVYLLRALGEQPSPRVLYLGDDAYLLALLLARYGDGWVDPVPSSLGEAVRLAGMLEAAGYHSSRLPLPDPARHTLGSGVYRQILAPAPISQVPARWLAAAQPGGVIVTAIRGGMHSPLVRLTVTSDRAAAVGPVLADTRQLPICWAEPIDVPAVLAAAVDKGLRRVSTIPGDALSDPAMRLLTGLLIPTMSAVTVWVDGRPHWRLADTRAAAADIDVDRGLVTEAGRLRLWQHVEAIHRRWTGWGRPARERFGLTATPHDACLWLDTPTNTVATLRPVGERLPGTCGPPCRSRLDQRGKENGDESSGCR